MVQSRGIFHFLPAEYFDRTLIIVCDMAMTCTEKRPLDYFESAYWEDGYEPAAGRKVHFDESKNEYIFIEKRRLSKAEQRELKQAWDEARGKLRRRSTNKKGKKGSKK